MRQHGTGEHEPIDIERLQITEQPFGSQHVDRFITRIRIAGETVVSGKMNNGGEAVAKFAANIGNPALHTFIGGKVHGDVMGEFIGKRQLSLVGADKRIVVAQTVDKRRCDMPAAAGDKNDFLFGSRFSHC